MSANKQLVVTDSGDIVDIDTARIESFSRILKARAEEYREVALRSYAQATPRAESWRAEDTARDFAAAAENAVWDDARASLCAELARWITRMVTQADGDFDKFAELVEGNLIALVGSASRSCWNNNSLNLAYLQAYIQTAETIRSLLSTVASDTYPED